MGEIDTKPIESVQTAITFFGQSNEQRKNSPTNDREVERESEIESLERELANVKVQLEAREAVHKQALLKLDHYQKTADELSTLLKNSDVKKNFYINQSEEAISRVAELESSLASMARRLADYEQLAHAAREELAVLREAEVESLSQMQAMERLLSEEKLRNKECAAALAAKEAEKLECLRDLELRIVEKSANIDSLQLEIEQAKKVLMLSESELNKLKEEMELQEKTTLDQAAYINNLEAEMKQMRSEVESVKTELEKAREQENEAQVEIALLKFQLHKGRSRLAAAEAAEARAQSEKTSLYNALQQMGLEAEETKKENRMLKEAAKLADPQENNVAEAEAEEEEMMSSKELEDVKRELAVAVSKIGELRTRAEQATSRAEAAEKAKAALEEQNKKRREHKERRKAALAALRLESMSREFERKSIKDDDDDDDDGGDSVKIYQPLGKVLNMKF